MSDAHERAARLLADLRLRRSGVRPPLPDLPDDLRPASMAEAYALQDRLGRTLEPELGRRVGFKIGLTSKVMQDYIGFDEPAYGQLYEQEIRRESARLAVGDYRRLGLECEIAVRLDRALEPDAPPEDAVGDVMCSVEIVEERFEDFRTASREAMVADDFFTRGVVLGAATPRAEAPDLGAITGGFSVGGEAPEATGAGAAILGHPMNALAWLAKARGGLDEGALVSLGSVVKTIYPGPGQRIEARFDGLAPVVILID